MSQSKPNLYRPHECRQEPAEVGHSLELDMSTLKVEIKGVVYLERFGALPLFTLAQIIFIRSQNEIFGF